MIIIKKVEQTAISRWEPTGRMHVQLGYNVAYPNELNIYNEQRKCNIIVLASSASTTKLQVYGIYKNKKLFFDFFVQCLFNFIHDVVPQDWRVIYLSKKYFPLMSVHIYTYFKYFSFKASY